MKKLTLLAMLALINASTFSQKKSFLKPTEASFFNSISIESRETISKEALNKLFQNEGFLSEEMIETLGGSNNQSVFHGNIGVSDYVLSLNLGFNILDKASNSYYKSPVIRFGFQFRSASPLRGHSTIRNENRIDTLVSNSGGNVVYVDSVEENVLTLGKHSDIINFDASLIFRTDTSKIWSLFGGAGISAGFTINSYTLASIRKHNFIDFTGDYSLENDFPSHSAGSWEYKQKRSDNKSNFLGSIYFPLGIDVRLGQQTSFWRRLHLFYEARPGVNLLTIPEIKTFTNFSIMHGAGLRVRF